MKPHYIPLIGAHMSIAGGLEKAIEAGQGIGCTCIQFFTHSNRQWSIKPLSAQSVENFKKAAIASSIKVAVIHSSYLVNIATDSQELHKKSLLTLIQELRHAQDLDIPYLIVHCGSRGKQEEDAALQNIAHTLDKVFEAVPGKSMICLENSAGTTMGGSFEQLAAMRKLIKHKSRIGFCFDTCHAFAAGYEFRTEDTYKKMLHDFDTIVGLEHLKVIHMNDSMKDIGSHVDRHTDIGKGHLGLEPFRFIMNDSRLVHVPKILETPHETIEDDARNLGVLRELVAKN